MSTHARVKYLCYEIEMLGLSKARLEAGEIKDRVVINALIESFCTHARNLNEFFLERSGWRDSLKASAFTDVAYKPPRRTKRRIALFDKINQQITHLTVKRTSNVRQKIGPRYRDEMYKTLYADLLKFNRHLRPRLRRKWRIRFVHD
jgi:hypothetical protein